jgi:SAM-dependent methyltransferase
VRENVKSFVALCADALDLREPIYEFGSYQVAGQEGLADLRPLFRGRRYVGCDMRPGPGVDEVMDLHNISLPSASAGTVLILETLEHVEFVRRAVGEALRILRDDGVLIISSAMDFPIHDSPSDYWRFTPEAFRSLLRDCVSRLVVTLGEDTHPHTVLGVGFKGGLADEEEVRFAERIADWRAKWNAPQRPVGPRQLAKQFVPPIALDAYRAIRNTIRARRDVARRAL